MRLTILAATLFMLLFAACGGAAAPTGAGEPAPATAATGTSAEPEPPADTEPPPDTEPPASEGPAESTSTGSGSGNGGSASRPCDLVSQADAEAAAGVGSLSPNTLIIDQTSGICAWHDGGNQVEVYAGVWELEAAEAQWASMDYLAQLGGGDVERVEGLGGEAIFSSTGPVLLVFKNGTLVQLTIRSPELDAAQVKSNLLDLGKAVLGRL